MQPVSATEVFTPNAFPALNYVTREKDFDGQVKNGLRTPGIVISVSGPSKSGKSVLLQMVAGKDNLIRVFGAQIKRAEDVWTVALDWMDSPTARITQSGTNETKTTAGGGSVSVGVPGVLAAGGQGGYSQARGSSAADAVSRGRGGMAQVARDIGNSDYVLFVDDFHYMSRDLQAEVAKQLKAAAEVGIKSCVANVPHGADDVVRANPELRGRVQAIDMEYWTDGELEKIGLDGFPHLNMVIDPSFIHRLAVEACGSPQLMQVLCLQTCFSLSVYETLAEKKQFLPNQQNFQQILASTATHADSSTLVETLHGGPKTHGMDRSQYLFNDGTEGDVYRAVLLAIASDPPIMSLPYRDVVSRVNAVCNGRAPSGRNVSDACEQISRLASKTVRANSVVEAAPPIEWDKSTDPGNLHLVEPYFLFYLRSSPILRTLGRKGPNASDANPAQEQIPL
ncbi:MAG: hypothetical protein ACREFN_02315 [Acetobacteraceae bacterium]